MAATACKNKNWLELYNIFLSPDPKMHTILYLFDVSYVKPGVFFTKYNTQQHIANFTYTGHYCIWTHCPIVVVIMVVELVDEI